MHGIAQVVQKLADDLTLVFLLDPAKDGGVGRGRWDGDARFQVFSPFKTVAAELSTRLGSSPAA
jgi:hypothetical protein